ncbi:MAG: tetratricopeptide repeat protein [Flavobacteriales bacterium]
MNTMARIIPAFLILSLLAACGGAKPVASGDTGDGPMGQTPKDRRALEMQLFLDGTSARLQGDPTKAAQLYQAALKVNPDNGAAWYELSKLYSQAQQGSDALAFAKKAVAADADNIWYRFLLADLNTQTGDLVAAAKTYQGIVNTWPERYEVYFGLADVLARQGKVKDAQQVYRNLEKKIGSNEELVTREYDMLVSAGQEEAARDLMERAIAENPTGEGYYGMLAGTYESLGDTDKARELYERALLNDPDDSMTRISLAQSYYDEGAYAKGFEQLKEAFSDPDLDVDPKMQLLLGFYQMTGPGQQDSTQTLLLRQSHDLIDVMKKAHPLSGKPWSMEGDFYLREDKPEQARDAFRKALVYEQDKYPIWGALLQLDLQLQDWAALHEDSEKAAELFPTQPELHLYDGLALGQLKKQDEAIEALITGRNLVVDNKPLEAQFWGLLGDAYNTTKAYDKSDEAYTQALALNDKDPSVLNNWAYYLSERGEQLDKAEQLSRKCNEMAPGNATYEDTYAWVLYKQGKYDKAKEWQEKALASQGSDEGVLLEHYGDILFKLNDKPAAVAQWQKAQAAGGASPDIDRKIAEQRLVE